MFTFIDNLLNRITMYRLVLYFLIILLTVAALYAWLGFLSFGPLQLVVSTLSILLLCWAANNLFAYAFDVPANVESVYITALILALIISPAAFNQHYSSFLIFIFWASVWAMAGKFIFAFKGKHIFNPAAFAVALTAITMNDAANWWVGTAVMLPLVLIGGLLIIKKIQRFDLVLTFLVGALVSIFATSSLRAQPLALLHRIFLDTPILFFASIMLTEPLTTPPTRTWRMLYGGLVGLLYAPAIHLGGLFSTPELALLAGNIFSYVVSPKGKYLLKLREVFEEASGTLDFVFSANRRLAFEPGQYLEWTLPMDKSDSRGNRRYFTIASSPTENKVHLGVRVYPNPSRFKQVLTALNPGDIISATSLAGDFTLPKDPNIRLAFVAGGIGITPFRSMVKYLTDKRSPRDIVLFYSNKNDTEVAYANIFEEAQQYLELKVVNQFTDSMGHLDASVFATAAPDFMSRVFYISGPRGFVTNMERILKTMGVPRHQIKTDFFPGFV